MDAEYKTNQQNEQFLSVKEVAYAIGRNVSYVYRMRRMGFKMPGNRTTLSAVRQFLAENPFPWKNYRKTLNSTKKR